MEVNQQRNDEIEIDLREVFAIFVKKSWLVVLLGVIFALATIVATKMFITPTYQSTTKMYVLAKQDRDTVTSGDLQTSSLLTEDYVELIKSRTVTEAVIAQLGLKLTHEQLLAKLDVTVRGETRIIYVSAIDEDPYVAKDIANAVRDSVAVHIKNVMNTEAVNVVEEANIPDEKFGLHTKRNGVLAGAVGVLLAVIIILVQYLGNDTITTAEDVEKYLKLSTLGTIPMNKSQTNVKKKKVRNYKKR